MEKSDFESRLAMLVRNQQPKLDYLNMRVNSKVKEELQENADKYTKGNLSEWMIISALEYKPWR